MSIDNSPRNTIKRKALRLEAVRITTSLPASPPIQHRLNTIADNVTVRFSGGEYVATGTILHDPAIGLLVLDTRDGEPEERLSVNLAVYGLFPSTPNEVLIKDWSEHEGLAQSLVDAGIAEIVEEHAVGPFHTRVYRIWLLPQFGPDSNTADENELEG